MATRYLTANPIKAALLIGLVLLYNLSLPGQSHQVDSLLDLKSTLKADSNKCTVMNRLAWNYFMTGEYSQALSNASESNTLSKEIKFAKGEAESYNITGVVYCSLGSYPKALEYFFQSLTINEKLGDKRSISRNLMNIGIVYMYQFDHAKSLDYLMRSMNINEERSDQGGIAGNLINIALVYRNQKNFSKSLEYYFKALEINNKIENDNGRAKALSNIGIVYEDQGDSAREAGNTTAALTRYDKAKEYYLSALDLEEQLGDKEGVAHTLGSLSSILLQNKKLDEAEMYLKKAMELATELGSLELLRFHHQTYYKLYKEKGDYKTALEHFEKQAELKDSMFNAENERALGQKEIQFEHEKNNAVSGAGKEKIEAVSSLERSRQRIIIFSISVFFILAAFIGVLLLKLSKLVKRQKNTVILQEERVE
jgi:tetratricopeptide (TPR) repeat protein